MSPKNFGALDSGIMPRSRAYLLRAEFALVCNTILPLSVVVLSGHAWIYGGAFISLRIDQLFEMPNVHDHLPEVVSVIVGIYLGMLIHRAYDKEGSFDRPSVVLDGP
uniref:Uncharacterized protein n=1 Tax=Mucochytrium quahogii TaxID=96639 RepID=A0A7S2WBQ2_9STRA|mmetsp:Transcript_14441/g.23516  ORF Transcript_14441/g.23516 Transcript_14441/m.23516 type:complete len:107 (+) Transcript_14441:978-1298(+)